jgi:hypothetical protein
LLDGQPTVVGALASVDEVIDLEPDQIRAGSTLWK